MSAATGIPAAKPKIYQLITSLGTGGTERFLEEMVMRLRDRYEFRVGYLKQGGATAERLAAAGVPVECCGGFWGALASIRRFAPGIVHTHLFRANVMGRIAARLAGTARVVSSQRSIDAWKRRIHSCVDRCSAIFADIIVANSMAAKNILVQREKIPQEKIRVIYSGPALKPTNNADGWRNKFPSKNGEKWACTMTRLHAEKGADLLPELAEELHRLMPAARLAIAGDGPLFGRLWKKCAGRPNIVLLGEISDRAGLLSAMSAFFLMSREESLPMAALEAMSAGLPVAATRVGGTPEIFTGSDGILVEPENPAAMARVLAEILSDDERRRRMGEAAKKRSALFSMQSAAEELSLLYDELLERDR